MPDTTPTPTKRTRASRAKAGHSQTVPLDSGGSITLAGDFNLFTMSTEDVNFVSDLGARMREYASRPRAMQDAQKKPTAPPPQATTRPAQAATIPGPRPVATPAAEPGTSKPS